MELVGVRIWGLGLTELIDGPRADLEVLLFPPLARGGGGRGRNYKHKHSV